MHRRLGKRLLTATLLLLAISAASAATQSLVVERARTRVGIARVILNIDALKLTAGGLVGTYAIRVPLAPFMDDSGTIEIPITDSLEDSVVPGKTVRGTASSGEDGRVHGVECIFKSRDKVQIVVTTPGRTLSFVAPYALGN